jgi:RNA polymerase sigma factor (sigma-70 family)
MVNGPLNNVLTQVRKLVTAPGTATLTDRELLERFVHGHQDAAFAAMVNRHGPLVLGVCRRILKNADDAEDACQATFLLLFRKATSIRKGEALSSWLHGVAFRAANNLRRSLARRPASATSKVTARPADPADLLTWREVLAALDEEINRLPKQFRGPLLLCYCEDKSRDEAAQELGVSLSQLRGRLARGRELLRTRLTRRGITLSAAMFCAVLGQKAAFAALAPALAASLVKAATPVGTSTAIVPRGAISAEAAALANGILRWRTITTMRILTMLLLALCTVCLGAGLIPYQADLPQHQPEAKPSPRKGMSDQPPPPGDRVLAGIDCYGDPLPQGAAVRLGTVRLRREDGTSASLAFTPDGNAIVSAKTVKVVQFWDSVSGKPLHELRQEERFGSFSLSRDGKILATATAKGINVWDAVERKQLCQIATQGVQAVAVAPDSKTLASGEKDKTIRLWEAATGKLKQMLAGHADDVHTLLFSPDGKTLVSAGSQTIRVWDVAAGKEVRAIETTLTKCVSLSPDGAVLATGGTAYVNDTAQGRIVLWNLATGQPLRELQGHRQLVETVAFSHDGKTLASDEIDTIQLWDVGTGKQFRRMEKAGWRSKSLAFSPDGKTLASTAPGTETVIRRWDVATGKALPSLGHEGVLRTLAFSPDGKVVATGSWLGYDFNLRLWDSATGKLLRVCEGHQSYIQKVVFTADGQGLFSASIDGTLRLWDVQTGKETRKYTIHPDRPSMVMGMALAGDGKSLTSIHHDGDERDTLIVWDVATGKRLLQRQVDPGFRNLVPFSADGSIVAEPFGHALRLCDTATGKKVLTLPLPKPQAAKDLLEVVAFSLDGRTVAAVTAPFREGQGSYGSAKWACHLWESVTGKTIRRLVGSESNVDAIAFAPDGRTLATAGKGIVQLWDVATGKELLAYRGQDAGVSLGAIAFSPDGTKLAVGYLDSTALLWDLTQGMARTGLSAKNLSPKELEQLWSDLAKEDPATAHGAVWTLLAVPEKTLPLFANRLKPVEPIDPQHLRQLLANLDSPQYTVRAAAVKELKDIADQAEPLLREALQQKASLEVQRRIEEVLQASWVPTPEFLRTMRAIQVLELIGTREAEVILKALAKGAPTARQTREAKAVLERLATRLILP